jgi:hypothetical protein
VLRTFYKIFGKHRVNEKGEIGLVFKSIAVKKYDEVEVKVHGLITTFTFWNLYLPKGRQYLNVYVQMSLLPPTTSHNKRESKAVSI